MNIRIVVKKRPLPEPTSDGHPAINARMPDFSDVEIYGVDDDGKEHPITGVSVVSLEWGGRFVEHGRGRGFVRGRPLTATLECYIDSVDIECERAS